MLHIWNERVNSVYHFCSNIRWIQWPDKSLQDVLDFVKYKDLWDFSIGSLILERGHKQK